MADVPDCCKTGFVWEGTPTGSLETIGGVEAYIARPKTPSTQYIVIFTDVFGHVLPNVRLIADSIASRGLNCVVPDILNGDPMKPEALDFFLEKSKTYMQATAKVLKAITAAPSLVMWFPKHGDSSTLPIVTAVVDDVRERLGATKIGTIGYCFGGRYSVLMGGTDKIDAFATAHASNMAVPKDLLAVIKPGLMCLAEKEMTRSGMIAIDQAAGAEKIFASRPNAATLPKVLLKGFKGTAHGFAVRGNEDDPVVKEARDNALASMLDFFEETFKQ